MTSFIIKEGSGTTDLEPFPDWILQKVIISSSSVSTTFRNASSGRITKESSSRHIMRLEPVFILETHNQTNYKCLPKFFQTDNAFSSIKTAIPSPVIPVGDQGRAVVEIMTFKGLGLNWKRKKNHKYKECDGFKGTLIWSKYQLKGLQRIHLLYDYNIYHSCSLISTFCVAFAAVIGHCFFPFFRWKPYLAVYIISWK